jgi:hypothetical protein
VITVRSSMIAFGAVLLMAMGCAQDEKIANLERQNQELKAEVEKNHATADYDLQAKCSRDAKTWFNENWSRDKDTLLLDFTNHYNKSMNKCFILVEYNYSIGANGSWVSSSQLSDVYENSKFATFAEHHSASTDDRVNICELSDKKCKTPEEFNDFVRPYLNN